MNSKINTLSCTFEDSKLEENYLDNKWVKVSSFYTKVPIVTTSGLVLFLLSLYLRNAFELKTTIIPIILIAFYVIIFFQKDEFKRRFLDKSIQFMAIVLMPLWMYLDFERLSNLPHIAFLPLMQSILWISLFPFTFVPSIVVSTIPFLASFPILVNYDSMNIPMYIVFYFNPHFLLILNKWKAEKESRSNFLKGVIIENNEKLMHQTLKRYFGDTLSDKIISQKGELEGENKWVTILFADLGNYSTITESMSPEVALEFLNEYFTKMHEVIKEFEGHTLNYIGDSVMVVFGAPEKLKNHENQAVMCSLKMKEKLKELNQEWDKKETSRYWKNHNIDLITMRIGIHTGTVIAGNVGSQEMMQYSTIGDTVNVAARLEQANKDFKTEISFSHEIYTALTKDLHAQAKLSGEITLKGRAVKTKVYSI